MTTINRITVPVGFTPETATESHPVFIAVKEAIENGVSRIDISASRDAKPLAALKLAAEKFTPSMRPQALPLVLVQPFEVMSSVVGSFPLNDSIFVVAEIGFGGPNSPTEEDVWEAVMALPADRQPKLTVMYTPVR